MPKVRQPSRPKRDSAHQWIFAVLHELTPAQAGRVQRAMDSEEAPDRADVPGTMLATRAVFCWRCLLPFNRATALKACRGGPRYEAEQNLLTTAVISRAAAAKKRT